MVLILGEIRSCSGVGAGLWILCDAATTGYEAETVACTRPIHLSICGLDLMYNRGNVSSYKILFVYTLFL